MYPYKLDSTVPSPGSSTTILEFSPDGRYLAIGDSGHSLCILDGLAGFNRAISAATPANPTALVWDGTEALHVGFGNGCFISYRIDFKCRKLVKSSANKMFYGPFPVTAIAIDAGSKTLVICVGPHLYAFRKNGLTSEFNFVANVSSRFKFRGEPGIKAPPFPRSICLLSDNMLIVALCRQKFAFVTLNFIEGLGPGSSLQAMEIKYPDLPLVKAVASTSDDGNYRLARLWVHDNASQTHGETPPFLFINGGMATLSGSASGAVVIKDSVTGHEIQLLNHACIGRGVPMMAYHVSDSRWRIATAGRGPSATINIWTGGRHSRVQLDHSLFPRTACAVAILAIGLAIVLLS